jgi:hypothetical protein
MPSPFLIRPSQCFTHVRDALPFFTGSGQTIPHWPLPAVRDLTRDGKWSTYDVSVLKLTNVSFRGKCASMGNTLNLPPITKKTRLARSFSLQLARRAALPARCSMYMSFLWADHLNSPVLWSGCGTGRPAAPLLSMGHVITLEFASNGDVTGSGFRLIADELTAGCGGVLHGMVRTMDEGTIKTPNPKCRLYWCLVEFIDRRTVSHVYIFDPSCERAPL